MNSNSWEAGRVVVAAHAQLTALLQRTSYREMDKARIVALLDTLGLTASDTAELAVLRQVRGRLSPDPKQGALR